MYYIATGKHPFYATHELEYKEKVLKDEVDYTMFNSYRDAALVKFMQKMINKNQFERAKIEELLNDEWLTRKG